MQTTIHSNKTQSHRANNADGALGADGSIIQESTALAVGLLIYSLLRAIPFGIGWVIGAIVTLLSLGSFVIVLHRAPHP